MVSIHVHSTDPVLSCLGSQYAGWSLSFVQNDDKKGANVEILSCDESIERQFYNFLKRMRMERHFEKFKQNEHCDMDSIELFDDETLKEDIGITNKIHRKKPRNI